MRIVVAIDNEKIKLKLDEIYAGEIYEHDINYMEGVIEYLSKNRGKNEILITRDNIPGNLTKEMYVKQLKLADDKIKIILLTTELASNYKEFLFANGIFNIIESEVFNIEDIKECINRDENVVYKVIQNSNNNLDSNQKINNKISYKNQIISKQVIAVFGTGGSGKSYISNIISKQIVNDLKIGVSLIDMDIQNACVDIFNNLENSELNLSKLVDDIDKFKSITNIIEQKAKSLKKGDVAYITNNASIYECQNKLNIYYYNKIYEACANSYDFTIIDLPASPFLDVVQHTLMYATQVVFVVRPNYISIRQAIKYLELMTKLWGISKSKICIIVNCNQKNSLDTFQLESLLEGYDIIEIVNFNMELEGYINGANFKAMQQLDLNKWYDKLGIVYRKNKPETNKKIIFSGIFKSKKKVGEIANDN